MSVPEEDQHLSGEADSNTGDHAPELDPDSTVGVGSFIAIGCTLLMLIMLLIGVGIFIARQVN